ncbi:MAG: CHAD domain-containing protein [Pseudonocardiales bacterium]|nr:CHAD domain-containing protein [Pseudonocardiales bacterium]
MLNRSWADDLRAELGWLGGVLGPVRDADVLIERLRGRANCLWLLQPGRGGDPDRVAGDRSGNR